MNPRYDVCEIIAEGGLGSVHRGWDLDLGREVAIKRVRVACSGASNARKMELLNEARTLSTLKHPNIVSVYDSGEDEQGAYLVMELVKGENLEQIIERGALSEADFEQLAIQTLEGLIAAHAVNVVHLDLKPMNVMVCWSAIGQIQIKLLDFGLAQMVEAPSDQATDGDGSIMGSVFFMAPEQFERGPVDRRTDLYALGEIFYHALTQQYPFQGETGPQVMVAHLKHRFIPLIKYRPDLDPFVPQWVEWLMSCKPADRPNDAAEALKSFLERRFPE
jgi:serine/threonine protein kinase